MFPLWAEFSPDQVPRPRPQAVADVITRDDEIGAILRDAPHQQVDMGIVGVPVIDRDPIEPGPEIAFHLGHEVAGEGLEVGHFSGILRPVGGAPRGPDAQHSAEATWHLPAAGSLPVTAAPS